MSILKMTQRGLQNAENLSKPGTNCQGSQYDADLEAAPENRPYHIYRRGCSRLQQDGQARHPVPLLAMEYIAAIGLPTASHLGQAVL